MVVDVKMVHVCVPLDSLERLVRNQVQYESKAIINSSQLAKIDKK